MEPYRERRTPRLALAICLAAATGFAFTAITDAAEAPSERVHRARDAAERGAAARAALGPELLSKAAATVRPPSIEQLPSDWVGAGLDPARAELVDGRLVQTLPSGARVTLTIEPETQRHLEAIYRRYKIPAGGVVLLDPASGRVRAMVGTNSDQPERGHGALASIAPSASVFKVVTIAALLEDGVSPESKTCYHGGRSALTKANIEGNERLDTRCGDLSDAMAWSINSLIAKRAFRHLSATELAQAAERFGYNQPIPFELPVEISRATIPDDPIERARTAAGFWNTELSPLHGAMISAAALNDGVIMRPTLIRRYVSPSGRLVHEPEPEVWRRAMPKTIARQVRRMMERTTSVGTARKYFRHRKDFPRDITTGGKTGTLSRKGKDYLGYTWFVGFGRSHDDDPIDVAVGGLVCNKPLWHIKGPWAASEAIRVFVDQSRKRRAEQEHAAGQVPSEPRPG